MLINVKGYCVLNSLNFIPCNQNTLLCERNSSSKGRLNKTGKNGDLYH